MDTITVKPAAQPFNVADYELKDSATLTLKNKAGTDDLLGNDGQPVTVEVYSTGSEPGVKARRRQSKLAQMRLARTLRGELDSKDAENADREEAEKIAGFTVGFSANFPLAPLAVYSNPKLGYITRQVAEFIAKDANF